MRLQENVLRLVEPTDLVSKISHFRISGEVSKTGIKGVVSGGVKGRHGMTSA